MNDISEAWCENYDALYRAARGMRIIMLKCGEVIVNGAMCSSELISDPVRELGEQHMPSSKTLVSAWSIAALDSIVFRDKLTLHVLIR